MLEVKAESKLSTVDYWDTVLEAAQLPRLNTKNVYRFKVTMDFIDEYLKNSNYKTLLEVGCGSSGWLPYFAKKYNLKVSGIDYSEIGCRLAEENLKMQNINYGEIICKDIFESNCTNGKKYDIVFSYGVIEHFENAEEVVRLFSTFLNPGGLIVTLVPNLKGAMGALSRYFVKDIYDMHIVIDVNKLKSMHKTDKLELLKCNYAGTFTFSVLPLIRSKKWLFKEDSIQRKISTFSIDIADKLITKLFTLININLPSEYFSPYVICVAKKVND
jgi:2-polyprenyl-3-methyl-5-hydroxy-6-metoxy-1,4-benzoquinol methylase